jgi:hypothetical protein
MISTLASENCAYCHDSFPHHVLPSQYDVSRHANPTTLARGSRAGCSDCHSGTGFIAWLKNGQATPSEIPDPERISCAVCHDPHNAENEGQLRLVSATLSNGYEVTAGDAGKLCMNCHKGRRDAVDYTDNYLDNLSSHFGPHYGTQGDMLAGQNAVTWGETLPSTLHINIVSNACVGCHMAEGEIDAEGNIPLSGGHSFGMRTPEGVANVEACSACHGNIGEDFNEITSNFEGSKDHDGDGVEEGLQEEVHGLLDLIIANIPNDGSGHPMVEDSTVTLVEAQAAFNYLMVYEDRSFGIHNPKFTVALLKLTLEKLGVSAVEKTDILPSVYSLEQNYPNPFNPTTIINFSIPESGNVKLAIYDALGREVDILIDKEMTAGNYNADWNASNFAAGIYFYSITVNDFTSTKKMVLLK